ncbi:phosphatidic acid phosphatase type [Actinomortierella ambigua]|nr:phosphatidic acid phosphatase type [Actinomortierella ambigua]
MAGKMHIFDRRGYSLKAVLVLVPLLGAILIAISRIQDYRHTATQVTWGGIIGILCALFSYHQYYPSLTSRNSQIPFPPRDFSSWFQDRNQVPGAHEEQAREELGLSPRSTSHTPHSPEQQQAQSLTATSVNGTLTSPSAKTSDRFIENTLGIQPRHQFIDESRTPYANANDDASPGDGYGNSSTSDFPASVTIVRNDR